MTESTTHAPVRTRSPFRTMADVRRANKDAGYHFFDYETMQFFHSTIGRTLYGGRYFVTSEAYAPGGQRSYTVRRVSDDGDIETVGTYGQFSNGQAARAVALRLAREEAHARVIARARSTENGG